MAPRKPKGAKYQNLVLRDGVIYYRRVVDGKRVRFSTQTADWNEAAAVRDHFEEERKKRAGRSARPTLSEFAAVYLKEDTGSLAATTRRDRALRLRPGGPILGPLGDQRLDEITPPLLREWWGQHVTAKGLKVVTGRSYLDAIAGLFSYARELGLVDTNPVREFREALRRHGRTQKGRAEEDSKVRPVERPDSVERLVAASREEGPVAFVYVLLCLDAGLRSGEALGLTWDRIYWGSEEQTRSLWVDRSRARGGALGPTKSGRAREVALSLRLREALAALYAERGEPDPVAFVLDGVDQSNFRSREWRRILGRAGIGHVAIKDLRDTYASHLLTLGISPAYISTQLGHADWSVTAKHYGRWVSSDYVTPATLQPEEVPADLLARLSGPTRGPSRPRRGVDAETATVASARSRLEKAGARDRIRTGDPHVGNVMLYQLSYSCSVYGRYARGPGESRPGALAGRVFALNPAG